MQRLLNCPLCMLVCSAAVLLTLGVLAISYSKVTRMGGQCSSFFCYSSLQRQAVSGDDMSDPGIQGQIPRERLSSQRQS